MSGPAGCAARRRGGVVLAIVAGAVAACNNSPSPSTTTTAGGDVAVFLDSRLRSDGSLVVGRRVEPLGRVAEVSSRIRAGLGSLPFSVDTPVSVHLEPRVEAPSPPIAVAEVHVASGSLLVGPGALQDLPVGLLEHELAHLAMLGPRPTARAPRRALAAVEEAVADRVAAEAVGSPRLAGGTPWARDLGASSAARADWEGLALAGPVDLHELGLGLARELWRLREELPADDLVACFRLPRSVTEERAVSSTLARLVDACPGGVRPVLERALTSWLPAELAMHRESPRAPRPR